MRQMSASSPKRTFIVSAAMAKSGGKRAFAAPVRKGQEAHDADIRRPRNLLNVSAPLCSATRGPMSDRLSLFSSNRTSASVHPALS
jgi:hypothetical protein